jgi:hypothetical protein
MHLLAEGVEAEAETLGDILLRAAIDENGAKGFVEALAIAWRLDEEEATRGVVHNGIPRCESFRESIAPGRIAEARRSNYHRMRGEASFAGKNRQKLRSRRAEE